MDKIFSSILSSIPDCIDFDFITVKTETIKHIYLDNISEQSFKDCFKPISTSSESL